MEEETTTQHQVGPDKTQEFTEKKKREAFVSSHHIYLRSSKYVPVSLLTLNVMSNTLAHCKNNFSQLAYTRK